MDWQTVFNFEIWGNNGRQYLEAMGAFVFFVILFKLFQAVFLFRMKKISQRTKTQADDFLVELAGNIKPPFYFVLSLYFAFNYLELSEDFSKILLSVFGFVVVVQLVIISQKLIDYIVRKKILSSDKEIDKDKEAMLRLAGQLSKIVLWIFGGLLILSNLGIDITSLVAGLGIGGIAVALAAQGFLADIFASFSIFTDKPFKVGDFIEIGPEEKGTVERIGIKTTRLRTVQGQELVVANKRLTETTLQNYRRMKRRRVSFSFGVVYETELKKLREIPSLVATILEKQELVKTERVNFKKIADSSLVFEVVYVVADSSYKKFANIQQEINFQILEKFEEENIEIAYPTQTVHLNKK